MTTNWHYNGQLFTIEDTKKYIGMIYKITNLVNDKVYIGQKKFWKTIIRPPLKGQKKKRREIVPSDWEVYWGSSDRLKADIELFGEENFTREVLLLCTGKGEMNYKETKMQFDLDVLLNQDKYYNGIINCRINHSHLSIRTS